MGTGPLANQGELTYFPGCTVVKLHAYGVAWWEEQDMPPTLAIGCTTLLSDEYANRRTYLRGDLTAGVHLIYRTASMFIPSVEADSYVDTRAYWTRMPPDPTKYWIDKREPAKVDRWPDLTELIDLARSHKPAIRALAG